MTIVDIGSGLIFGPLGLSHCCGTDVQAGSCGTSFNPLKELVSCQNQGYVKFTGVSHFCLGIPVTLSENLCGYAVIKNIKSSKI